MIKCNDKAITISGDGETVKAEFALIGIAILRGAKKAIPEFLREILEKESEEYIKAEQESILMASLETWLIAVDIDPKEFLTKMMDYIDANKESCEKHKKVMGSCIDELYKDSDATKEEVEKAFEKGLKGEGNE